MTFRTTLFTAGKTATGLQVPTEIVERLGAGKKPPVSVTINGYTYRSSISVRNGVFMIPVSAAIREQAGVAGGDEIEVALELDTAPREVTVPLDFQQALDRDGVAKQCFDNLSYSNKQFFVLPIEQAKTAETRQRRIEKAVSSLREGKV
ncbi:MAG: YdeI/OmpD-associated family protein [Saprospiraceae bacterium]